MSAYEMKISVRSTFDGVIPDEDEYYADSDMKRIIDDLERYNDNEISAQVCEDLTFLLCLECKRDLVGKIRTEFTNMPRPSGNIKFPIH
jgi:hypothetical protein